MPTSWMVIVDSYAMFFIPPLVLRDKAGWRSIAAWKKTMMNAKFPI